MLRRALILAALAPFACAPPEQKPRAAHSAAELRALMARESKGEAGVVGPPAGAAGRPTGLLQVTDDTGRRVARRLGIAWRPELMRGESAEAKAYQVRIGAAYLEFLLDEFGGDRVLAHAAYNAGPAVVQDWIAGRNDSGKNPERLKLGDPRTGETTDAEFAARIPFEETREQVRTVLTAAGRPPGAAPRR